MENIKDKYRQLISGSKIFMAPDIPVKKLTNALASYGKGCKPGEVIALVDDTVFGGAKDGLMITQKGIHAKAIAASPKFHAYENIDEISVVGKTISVNYEEFLKFNMPPREPVVLISTMVKEIKSLFDAENPKSRSVEDESCSPSEDTIQAEAIKPPRAQASSSSSTEDTIYQELKKVQMNYGGTGKMLLREQISPKQRGNFCKNCHISNPGSILAFVDTTLLNSGKDGIAFLDNKIIWRNFSFEESQRITYNDVLKASFRISNDELIFKTESNSYKLTTVRCELDLQSLQKIFLRVAEFWKLNCTVMTDDEKLENELLDLLPVAKENYFARLQNNLMATHKLKSWGNHLGNAFDIFFAVSQDQENEAHRRNVITENSQNKKIATAQYKLLSIANNFPNYINRGRTYNPKFIKALQSEYVSFEIFMTISFKAAEMLRKHFDSQEAQQYISMVFDPLILQYIENVISKSNQQPRRKTLADVANPQKSLMENDVTKTIAWRGKVYGNRKDEDLLGNIINATLRQESHYENFHRHAISDEEMKIKELLLALYGEELKQSLDIYTTNLEKAVEGVFIELLE